MKRKAEGHNERHRSAMDRARRALFLVCLFLVLCGVSGFASASGADPSLSASLDRNEAAVGSIVTLTLRYELPQGAVLPEAPQIKGLEDLTRLDQEITENEIRVRLLVDRLGSWKTGPLTLHYTQGGEEKSVSTGAVSLTVLSNLGDKPGEAPLKPIQGIVATRNPWLKYGPWAAGLLGLLLLGAALLYWYRKRRKKALSGRMEDPPHIRARRELEELDRAGFFEKGRYKVFYFRFSEIMRRYLETLRDFPAAEYTTEEITQRIDNDQDRKLIPLLRQADLVKFADTVPTRARKEEQIKLAFDYIDETSPFADINMEPVKGADP